MGLDTVAERLTSVKSAKRTEIDTVRPSTRCFRIRLAVRSAIRSSSRRITCGIGAVGGEGLLRADTALRHLGHHPA